MLGENTNLAQWGTLFEYQQQKPIARIRFHGQTIKQGGAIGNTGTLRGFNFVSGESNLLFTYWQTQMLLDLQLDRNETLCQVRFAAFPADQGEVGFVEFIEQIH
jgi:hypothetical protein